MPGVTIMDLISVCGAMSLYPSGGGREGGREGEREGGREIGQSMIRNSCMCVQSKTYLLCHSSCPNTIGEGRNEGHSKYIFE